MDFDLQADLLIQKIKHFLIARSGRREKEATQEEFYAAFVEALREEIMINWTASLDTIAEKKVRIINYLSLEYLPGRLLNNHLANIGATDLAKAVTQKMERSIDEILSMECDPGLGNGGLGRLAACFLDSLATLHYPARGYGLRYQYGIFEQELRKGVQIERPDCWLLYPDPWEARQDIFSTTIQYRGRPSHGTNVHGEDVYGLEEPEEVRALPFDMPIIGYSEKRAFSVLALRLWSTKESPRNFQLQRYNAGFLDQAAENTSLTDVLYPNDQSEVGKRIRLKQEFLLVAASLGDIIRRHLQVHGDLVHFADKVRIQINDTHPALMIAELLRTLQKNFNYAWKDAWETVQTCCSYTNHTILREALEEWNESRMQELLPRQFLIIQKLNDQLCKDVRAKFPNQEDKVQKLSILHNGQVRMAHLSIYGSHKVNGVAELHTDILKTRVFPEFHELFPDKFVNVTNGVTQRRWLLLANPKLAEFITKRIGKEWIADFSQMEKLADFASDPRSQQEFLEIKHFNKQRLIDFLQRENPVRDTLGKEVARAATLPPTALCDVQVKRIHEYKRQLLNALHLIMLYQEILESPNSTRTPRMVLFGGKAAPGYTRAKQIIELICAIARTINKDARTDGKLKAAYIENYNVSKAEIIIPAADLSEQISTAGWEASGTGNMKFSMNGALTIGTEDGANIEMRQAVTDPWWPFSFGKSAEENAQIDGYRGWTIYNEHTAIRKALDALKDNVFAETEEEHAAFDQIRGALLDHDRFFVLRDLPSYFETQKKVEQLYINPALWAETALHNIAKMSRFSTDRSIQNYADMIWQVQPCPPDPTILEKVRSEYAAHDRCNNGFYKKSSKEE